MKSIIVNSIASLIITILVVFAYSKWNNPKIGYIKSAIILQDYKEMQDVNEQFNKELKIVQTNLDTLRGRYEKLKMAEPLITEKEKKNWLYRLEVAQGEFEKYNQQASEQMDARKNELSQKVLGKVNDFIQQYGKENKYKLILGTTSEGSILYGEDGDDLTQIILTRLNENYGSKKATDTEKK